MSRNIDNLCDNFSKVNICLLTEKHNAESRNSAHILNETWPFDDFVVDETCTIHNNSDLFNYSLKNLPPLGVFWDIENCQVPNKKNATIIVQRIRQLFYASYKEAEFLIVCDINKEHPQVIQELNDAQVNVLHVSSKSKNAADEKLRQLLRRFAEHYDPPAAVALISSDVNFATDLCDLRYRKKMEIILIHNDNIADALILCANKTIMFKALVSSIPEISQTNLQTVESQYFLMVNNLPTKKSLKPIIKTKLNILSYNCGGKVVECSELGTAVIRFSSYDYALRAQKRLSGENVCGNTITVSEPRAKENLKHYSGQKVKNQDSSFQGVLSGVLPVGPINPVYNNFSTAATASNSWSGHSDQQPSVIPKATQSFRPIRSTSHLGTGTISKTSNCNGNTNYSVESKNDPNDFSIVNKGINVTANNIELIISNLDASIEMNELYNILLNMLKQYVMVVNLTVTIQTDGSPMATVKVGTQQEAQLVISQLHHQWLGSKRVTVSYAPPSSDPTQLRFMVVTILQKVPGNRMPLFKFFELVGSRFHCTMSLSEVNKVKDVCKIIEGHGGRMIALTPEASAVLPSLLNTPYVLHCTIHCPNGMENEGWGEAESVTLPNISISLKQLTKNVNILLYSHMGWIPLLSFPTCYAKEIGVPVPTDDTGVPLEHLITCINTIELACSPVNKNIKYVKIKELRESGRECEDPISSSVSPPLKNHITMLCREIVDLLKTTDYCQLLMSRFIPAYHHHFGRQCRVADYGFTRLADLFEAISHVVQIIGTGTKRTITLTHPAQMRRFTSDLLRVLKISKQVALDEFPTAYRKVMHKNFNPVEYGLCTLEDLLEEVPENTVVISEGNNVVTVAIPKREQTPEEILKTQQFASEVFELLRHAPYCSMLFNKFVPAYHHHFGRQCKVSDYGFVKLAELFEAIPDTVELEGSFDLERKVKLKLELAIKVLGMQIQSLIKESNMSALHITALNIVYKQTYGYTLSPSYYSSNCLEDLIKKLNDHVKIVSNNLNIYLTLFEPDNRIMEIRVWSLLLFPPHSLNASSFMYEYQAKFQDNISLKKLEQLNNVILISKVFDELTIILTEYFVMAAHIYHILYTNRGFMSVEEISNVYQRKYGYELCASDFQETSLDTLLEQLFFVTVTKSNNTMMISLKDELSVYGISLPISNLELNNSFKYQDSSGWSIASAINYTKNWRRFVPPKPDTPPADHGWTSTIWDTPNKIDYNLNLSIPICAIDASKILMETQHLISPTRLMTSSYSHPLGIVPEISAPHPAVVPLPDKLIMKDESSDSGVNSTRAENYSSENEMNLSEHTHINAQLMQTKEDIFGQTFSTLNM